jgi:hypothetical protein
MSSILRRRCRWQIEMCFNCARRSPRVHGFSEAEVIASEHTGKKDRIARNWAAWQSSADNLHL